MKTVNYRGMLVVFQIPDHWVEEHDPNGGGTFYDPHDESVTLRLNVTTLAAPRDIGASDASEVIWGCLTRIVGPAVTLDNGQTFAIGQVQHTTERGTPLELHPLLMARIVPPRTVRIANFVTTTIPSPGNAASITSKLDAIQDWVRACIISDAPLQRPKRD